jgi:hypothetical protein
MNPICSNVKALLVNGFGITRFRALENKYSKIMDRRQEFFFQIKRLVLVIFPREMKILQ